MLEISAPGWIWCFALDGYPMGACQELKYILVVASLVMVAELVPSRYHITELVPLVFTLIMWYSHYPCDLYLKDKLM